MKLNCKRYCIEIIPENDQDVVYIEVVLGLTENDQTVPARRVTIPGLTNGFTHIEISKEDWRK